jgi:hypothetical protein
VKIATISKGIEDQDKRNGTNWKDLIVQKDGAIQAWIQMEMEPLIISRRSIGIAQKSGIPAGVLAVRKRSLSQLDRFFFIPIWMEWSS